MILYVCDNCHDHAPEICGRPNPSEIRIAPDGRWLCDSCASEEADFEIIRTWPHPAEYLPAQPASPTNTSADKAQDFKMKSDPS